MQTETPYDAALSVAVDDRERARLRDLRLRFDIPPNSPEWQFYAVLAPLLAQKPPPSPLSNHVVPALPDMTMFANAIARERRAWIAIGVMIACIVLGLAMLGAYQDGIRSSDAYRAGILSTQHH